MFNRKLLNLSVTTLLGAAPPAAAQQPLANIREVGAGVNNTCALDASQTLRCC